MSTGDFFLFIPAGTKYYIPVPHLIEVNCTGIGPENSIDV
jgi:hypothetical protein